MIHLSLTYLLLLQLTSFIIFNKVSGEVPSIIVFGDSTVDAGNNNHITTLAKSNFRPYGRDFEGGKPTGRFCNGRLVTDFVSESFGIKPYIPAYLDPAYSIQDFATGVTFASAGTGYDNVTSAVASVIPMWKELEYFKLYQKDLINYMGRNNTIKTLREALYIISLGTNDFIENYFINPQRSSQFTIEDYTKFLVEIAEDFVIKLYQLGARKISLGGLPPIGCLPLFRFSNIKHGRACRDELNKLARDFDGKLKALVANLKKELKGIKLVFSNVLDPSLQIIANPYAYGFESVAVACCGTGSFELGFLCHESFTCRDASKYVFWDAVHPTEKLYQLVAKNLMKTSLAEFV